MNVLAGYKTYVVAVLMVIAAGLQQQGYITQDLFNTIQTILIGGGFAALRAAKPGA
jgi:hypothetical protein